MPVAGGGVVLDNDWIAALVDASSVVDGAGGASHSGVVAFTIGKKQQAVLDIVDGRVVGPGDAASIAVTVPVTGDQLASFVDGSASVATSYIRGDLKPVGSTGAFLAVVELFENPAFRSRLAGV